ncbi:hypothetical protein [Ferruginibacter sp. SUN106]|uniref:hypothetical protein n=1 Tax=Ferruginibacter sp. SUN106 TaxID=2978348 RepID=UPI003D3679D9
MKIIFFPLLFILFISCADKEKQKASALPRHSAAATLATVLDYDSCKKSILLLKQKNKTGWNKLSKSQKEKIFTGAAAETIIPSWIGTAWDFNGTSEIPQQGKIACGYFVTTVLRDAGLPIARIKLAQCASEQMVTALIQPKYVQRFSNVSIDQFIQAVQQQGFGLYIVGLDNHVGFIYNDGAEIYFIHSTFVGTRNVQKEKAAASWVLGKSKYKVLGKISADEKALNRWIN